MSNVTGMTVGMHITHHVNSYLSIFFDDVRLHRHLIEFNPCNIVVIHRIVYKERNQSLNRQKRFRSQKCTLYKHNYNSPYPRRVYRNPTITLRCVAVGVVGISL